MKNNFRHFSTWLLFIGIAVSFFAFINATSIYQKVQHAIDENNEYKYKYLYEIGISGIPDGINIIDSIKKLPGNIVSTGSIVYLDKSGEYHECDVIIKQDEELPYQADIINETGKVYIGRKLFDLCQSDGENTYIMINGEKVYVAGRLSSEKTDVLNYKIVFTEEADMAEQILENTSLYIECGSNQKDCIGFITEFYNAYYTDMNISYSISSGNYVQVGSENSDERFYMIISVFAIVNCIVISEFWILRRKKEIIIRKLCGFTNFKLFKLLYGQILSVAVLAAGFVLMLQTLMSFIYSDIEKLSVEKVGAAGIFIITSSVIITVLPIYKAAHFTFGDGMEMI